MKNNLKTRIALLLSLSAVLALAQSPAVKVRATCPSKAVAGKSITLSVDIAVPVGYHIYAPGDKTGVATSIDLTAPAGYKFKIKYPASKPYKGLGDTSQVFFGDVKIPVVVSIPKAAKGPASFKLTVTEQACNDSTCLVPATRSFSLSTSVK